MKAKVRSHLNELFVRHPELAVCEQDIISVYRILESCYLRGGKLLIAGNGGSAADAEHIVGELMKGFLKTRQMSKEFIDKLAAMDSQMGAVLAQNLQGALPAIALDGELSLTTAYMNDCQPSLCFAQQVNGYGNNGDTFLGISTSGNSRNVHYAAITARARGMMVIAMTGQRESALSRFADACIRVPEYETYRIQEMHMPVYHTLCLMLEERFFDT